MYTLLLFTSIGCLFASMFIGDAMLAGISLLCIIASAMLVGAKDKRA